MNKGRTPVLLLALGLPTALTLFAGWLLANGAGGDSGLISGAAVWAWLLLARPLLRQLVPAWRNGTGPRIYPTQNVVGSAALAVSLALVSLFVVGSGFFGGFLACAALWAGWPFIDRVQAEREKLISGGDSSADKL